MSVKIDKTLLESSPDKILVIGESDGEEISGIIGGMNDMLSTKIINADSYIM